MGGQDDHVSTFEDWGAPSPSPRTFFSAILDGEINSRSIFDNRSGTILPESSEGLVSIRNNENNEPSGGFMKSDIMFSEQKMNSRGGLLERMAARAGFNAPRLNTETVRTSGVSQNQNVLQSPYLTIPPGLSPTTLLESPVFLSNALAQPSPTTGQFPFSFGNINSRNFSSIPEDPDKTRENYYGENNNSSFAFKPVPEPGPSAFSGPSIKNFPGFEVSREVVAASVENSPPPDDHQLEDEPDQASNGGDPTPGGSPAEDGYNWRKYGQKQVKGSEYPRSYYKCTNPNCPVKKKVERSQEGHITEIIYKGAHNHPKPSPPTTNNRRLGVGIELADQGSGVLDYMHDNNLEMISSAASVGGENLQVLNGARFEVGDSVDGPCAFSNEENEDEDDRATHRSASLGYDGEEDESESKRRKIEAYATEMSGATRAIREPRVVVQTTSEVDILDDGYRWRKYGQKVVKGNPNPRSYYKCTHAGCTVRKHVERASHDLKSVITTYEGKHNHEVPAARNSSHLSSSGNTPAQNPPSVQAHQLQRPDPAQAHNNMARFDRPPPSFGRQQFGPGHGFGYGMGQPGLAHLAMAGLGPDRNKLPVLPVHHPYMGQQQNFGDMGFMMPKGEPKVEPLTEAPLNIPNGNSGYHQVMNRLPLGP